MLNGPTSLEVCAGAGGQAIGIERAGFRHAGLVEIEAQCCETLLTNRPNWTVHNTDLNQFDAADYKGVDLFAGGLPCPPFSVAGKQLGPGDERNLFPAAVNIVDQIRPKAIMIENVRGFLSSTFGEYRAHLERDFKKLGYELKYEKFNASDFGVPQLRPRVVIVALRDDIKDRFAWPKPHPAKAPTVGAALGDLMAERGWLGAKRWELQANTIAPTLVGGSKKHGGPDLGPTRAKQAWANLGVNGGSIAEEAPDWDFVGKPRLTVRMAARIQGFPDSWKISGKKTAAYRQVGNAFPPPVAEAVASQLYIAINHRSSYVSNITYG